MSATPKRAAVTPMNLTYDEAAGALRISKSSFRRLIDEGEITPVTMARNIKRVPVSEIDRYLEALLEAGRAEHAAKKVA